MTTAAPAVGVLPWLLSDRGEPALRARAQRLLAHIERSPELDAGDIGYSLALDAGDIGHSSALDAGDVGHSPAALPLALEHRAVVLGSDRERLLAGLRALALGESAANILEGVASGPRRVAFMFSGHGSQWPGMALELLDSSPVFAEHLQACADALAPFVDWSLLDVLRGESHAPPLERVDVVQPVLFAVTVSLAGLWRACGVQPDVVIGHSQGEIAAAHVAGGLSLPDAVRVVALRSRALATLAGRGGMVSVLLTPEQLAGRSAALGRSRFARGGQWAGVGRRLRRGPCA